MMREEGWDHPRTTDPSDVMVMTGGKTEIYNTLVIIGEGGLPDTTQIRGGGGRGGRAENQCLWSGELLYTVCVSITAHGAENTVHEVKFPH